jgi:hypothetical protein
MALWNASSISWVKIEVGLQFVMLAPAMPSTSCGADYLEDLKALITTKGDE